MNVSIKHNGTTITSRVISYNREHRICTSIGTLELVLEGTYSTSIDPWDYFDIYENGSFKVRYYVSSSSRSVPDGTITVECQDKSKRLVDYFIPKSYMIDYPSYTRYWIQKFLTEAGINYTFLTSSQGNLISNNTSLGLTSGYDQIMMLLQLSGWYMYFNGTGTAVIGTLDTDLATTHGSLGKTDIINIVRKTDDNMLRNRAVVWGQYDALRQEYAYADVSKHTPWNYDQRDLRTMVVSNSNIPNKDSAYGIANKLIKEFAKATIEKHITATGARNLNLGEMVRVNTNIWRGKGMITTFGVSMDRNGLVTNIVLDERCPRLFGFFNFGDYVYVGTFGDGIWRKHIKFDHTWYDFSSGLLDLNITDLHINSAIFGSVSASGYMHYANSESGPWNRIILDNLESSADNIVPSGRQITYQTYSGLMARATIVDKSTNNVKFGIDTWSGLNTGDYFTYSGVMANVSGIVLESGYRGWIIECDPYTGQLIGGIGSGIYPIQYSGNYNVTVLDLENDGINDYVSITYASGTGIPSINGYYDFGSHTTQPFASTKDSQEYSVTPASVDYVNNIGESYDISRTVWNENSIVAIDNTAGNQRMVLVYGQDKKCYLTAFTRTWNPSTQKFELDSTTVTSTASGLSSSLLVVGIYPDWSAQKFRIYYIEPEYIHSGVNDYFWYKEWDAYHNTWETSTYLGSQNTDAPLYPTGAHTSVGRSSVVINNVVYALKFYLQAPSTVGGYHVGPSYLYVYLDKIDMGTSTFSEIQLLEFITETGGNGVYDYFPGLAHTTSEDLGLFGRTYFGIFQSGLNGVQILGYAETYRDFAPTRSREYIFVGNDTILQDGKIWDDAQHRWDSLGGDAACTQLSLDKAMIGKIGQRAISGDIDGFTYNGNVFKIFHSPVPGNIVYPFYLNKRYIYPVLNDRSKYIALELGIDTKFYLIEASTMDNPVEIHPPTNYTLQSPYSSPVHAYYDQIYFTTVNLTELRTELVPYNLSSFDTAKAIYPQVFPNTGGRSINFGDIFISEPYNYAGDYAEIVYIDLGTPEYGGGSYMVLQRDGLEYNLIREYYKPLRVDISNNSPIVTVADMENTFQSDFVYGSGGTSIIPTSGLKTDMEVRDYRYTMLETVSGIIMSGVPSKTQILYANPSGIYIGDAETYSGGFYLFDTIFSGSAERIETSNYVYPGQFIFVTTSGENPTFYQRDNDALFFDEYSGLPSSRCTIIRLDDRF